MGKVEDLRALREARRAPLTSAGQSRSVTARKALEQVIAGPAAVTGELCGHRAVGGKLCIRAKGHQAEGTKSHKYAKTEAK